MVADFVGFYVGDQAGILPRQQGYSSELSLTGTGKRGASEGRKKVCSVRDLGLESMVGAETFIKYFD